MEQFCRLSAEERAAVAELLSCHQRQFSPHDDLVREGDKHSSVLFVLDGWGMRYKVMADGRRQILALLLPGDVCDPHSYLLREIDHSIGALTRLRVASVPHDSYEALVGGSARLCEVMRWHEMVGVAIQREWTLNLGQRSALERVGHVLCEIFYRLEMVGRTRGDSCDFPVVQNDLADIAGLTPVHVNRTLQELRRLGLIVLENRRLTLPKRSALEDLTLFNSNYLHAGREGAHWDAND